MKYIMSIDRLSNMKKNGTCSLKNTNVFLFWFNKFNNFEPPDYLIVCTILYKNID